MIIGERYELGRMLGEGSMGVVYKGKDLETGEDVAVKSLKKDVIEMYPDLVERFSREGDALEKLQAPYIVKLKQIVLEDDGQYLVMEYAPNGSLRGLLKQEHNLPIADVIKTMGAVANALAHAHAQGIVHRDIKPENILLAADWTPRLTDFGVARLGYKSRMTEAGDTLGTFEYLSPEGCNGMTVDERTDIWSLGVVMYESLAGKNPFKKTTLTMTLVAVVMDPSPKLLEDRPETPAPLVELIDRMLIKDREARISTMAEVASARDAM
jgi:serine/threonine-protein kinase